MHEQHACTRSSRVPHTPQCRCRWGAARPRLALRARPRRALPSPGPASPGVPQKWRCPGCSRRHGCWTSRCGGCRPRGRRAPRQSCMCAAHAHVQWRFVREKAPRRASRQQARAPQRSAAPKTRCCSCVPRAPVDRDLLRRHVGRQREVAAHTDEASRHVGQLVEQLLAGRHRHICVGHQRPLPPSTTGEQRRTCWVRAADRHEHDMADCNCIPAAVHAADACALPACTPAW